MTVQADLAEANLARANPRTRRLAVVVPAYQASNSIGQVLMSIPSYVQHVVVVDDGSSDGTAEAVMSIEDKRIHLLRHDRNRGVGAATMSGYARAAELGAEIFVKVDADGQMDPACILPLVCPILVGEADYTKGNRFLHTGALGVMPFRRRVGNAALSFLTKLASGYWNVFDPTNGFTAVHGVLLPLIDRRRLDDRYFFETSLLIELGSLHAVVKDVYFAARYRGETSHLSLLRSFRDFPPRLLRALVCRVWLEYFIRDFTLLSVYLLSGSILVSFGSAWGAWHWIQSAQQNVPASTGTVMLAVLPVILGMQFLLQAMSLDIQHVPTDPVQRTSDLARIAQSYFSEE